MMNSDFFHLIFFLHRNVSYTNWSLFIYFLLTYNWKTFFMKIELKSNIIFLYHFS